MQRVIVRAVALLACILCGCGGGGSAGSAPALESLSIAPSSPGIAAGLSLQLTATANYGDGSHTAVTSNVSWISSSTGVATVSASSGNVMGVAAGTTTISASFQGVTGSDSVSVTAATLSAVAIKPSSASTPLGVPLTLQFMGTYSDHSTQDLTANANWSSSATAVATIAANGTVTPLAVGQSTITASCAVSSACGTQSATAQITVTAAALASIGVTGAAPSIATGQTETFSAMGTYTDGSAQSLTTQVIWSSANTSVGTINGGGGATAVAPGTAMITANLNGVQGSATLTVSAATLGLTWPVATYEAEAGTLSGLAAIVGAADGSDRIVGDLGGEASGRQGVVLTQSGDSVSWTVQPTEAGANAVVVRYSIPDAPGGGGQSGSLMLTVVSPSGQSLVSQPLQLTSRYTWLYGGVMDGTKLYNSPANATTYATASGPTHLYDEIQLKLGSTLPAGSKVTLAKTASSGVSSIAIDFVDVEVVPAPIALPNGFVSLTDPRCGGMATDLRGTGAVFDGADDSSYGSVFNAVIGTNPNNPTSFLTQEKDYYSTVPTDALQDTTPNAATANLSLFALADHNLQSLISCVNLVTTSNGSLTGVYVPAGRYYVRGRLLLPSNVTLQGAGMWYSKFAAVDTAPPSAVTVNGVSGIASVSGNFSVGSAGTGVSNAIVSNLAIFGNVTQRDVVDAFLPDGLRAVYSNSIVDNVWVEHMFGGLKLIGVSNASTIMHGRVRNTFADGIDLYGSASNSIIANSSSRSTGDDGFALWSQGTTLAATSQNNTVKNSQASLQWYGNGFAIYGGIGINASNNRAADILNYPCLKISTYFVSPLLPSAVLASASANQLNCYRGGGNGFNQHYGGVQIETEQQSWSNVALSNINIAQPANEGIDVRQTPKPSPPAVVATMQTSVSNVQVVGSAQCATVGADTGGSLALNNVCSCASAAGPAQACPVMSTAPNSTSVATPSCSLAACSTF